MSNYKVQAVEDTIGDDISFTVYRVVDADDGRQISRDFAEHEPALQYLNFVTRRVFRGVPSGDPRIMETTNAFDVSKLPEMGGW